MQTLQDRIDKIIQAKVNRDNEEKEKRIVEANKRANLLSQIKELAPRITELITLANTCRANGIGLSDKYFYHSYDKDIYFFTDGFYHYLGFYNEKVIQYIGIMNGGACGNYDLRVNTKGEVIVTTHDYVGYSIADIGKISTGTLERFVEEFSKFEEKFLNWIDNLK
jgi:hypothetical protein